MINMIKQKILFTIILILSICIITINSVHGELETKDNSEKTISNIDKQYGTSNTLELRTVGNSNLCNKCDSIYIGSFVL